MILEIERKFLVKAEFKHLAVTSELIKQGYLSTDHERTVRVRIAGNKGYITIKGKTSENGITRPEFEIEIDVEDADKLLALCVDYIIVKTRYYIPNDRHTFVVDVFEELNKGLVIAEIELTHEDEFFIKPNWLGEEVTGKKEYYNTSLLKNPFKFRE
jgi:CYTH domain-containing protein